MGKKGEKLYDLIDTTGNCFRLLIELIIWFVTKISFLPIH